jgi:hypothetical protein
MRSQDLELLTQPLGQETCKVGRLPLVITRHNLPLNKPDLILTLVSSHQLQKLSFNLVNKERPLLAFKEMLKLLLMRTDHSWPMDRKISQPERPLELNNWDLLPRLNRFSYQIQTMLLRSSRSLDQLVDSYMFLVQINSQS